MSLFVSMSGFVDDWKVSFSVVLPATMDTYADNGKLIKGVQPAPVEKTGIVLPLSNDELAKGDNGNYTQFDRKVYINEQLPKGAKVIYKGETYEIDRELPQSDYTDVYRYYAKGKGAAYA